MHLFEWLGTLFISSAVALITFATAPDTSIRHQGLTEYTVEVAIQLPGVDAPEVMIPKHRPGTGVQVTRGWVVDLEAKPVAEGLVHLTGSLRPSDLPSVPEKSSRIDVVARVGDSHVVSVATPRGLRHVRLTPTRL